MIVGATPTPDVEILKTASELYTGQRSAPGLLFRLQSDSARRCSIARTVAAVDSRTSSVPSRLADAFLWFLGDEIVAEKDQNLSLDIDPKLAWALANRHFFPVDVNRASREELLRIPGIGVRNVKRILSHPQAQEPPQRRPEETASRLEPSEGVRVDRRSQSRFS